MTSALNRTGDREDSSTQVRAHVPPLHPDLLLTPLASPQTQSRCMVACRAVPFTNKLLAFRALKQDYMVVAMDVGELSEACHASWRRRALRVAGNMGVIYRDNAGLLSWSIYSLV